MDRCTSLQLTQYFILLAASEEGGVIGCDLTDIVINKSQELLGGVPPHHIHAIDDIAQTMRNLDMLAHFGFVGGLKATEFGEYSKEQYKLEVVDPILAVVSESTPRVVGLVPAT